MSDILSTISVDQLNSSVSRAVSCLSDLTTPGPGSEIASSTNSNVKGKYTTAISSFSSSSNSVFNTMNTSPSVIARPIVCTTNTTTNILANDSHVFAKPSAKNGGKKRRPPTTNKPRGKVEAIGETTTSLEPNARISMIKPRPVSITRSQPTTSGTPTDQVIFTVVSGSKDNTTNSSPLQMPLIPALSQYRPTNTFRTYIPLANDPSILSPITVDGKSIQVLPPHGSHISSMLQVTQPQNGLTIQTPGVVSQTIKPQTPTVLAQAIQPQNRIISQNVVPQSHSGILSQTLPAQTGILTQNLQPQGVVVASNSLPSSPPQDLLAAATQAAIPHLITQYPRHTDIASSEITTNNSVISQNLSPLNTPSPPVQPLTVYQLNTTPTLVNNSSPIVVSSGAVTPSSQNVTRTFPAVTNVTASIQNNTNVNHQPGTTVYTIVLDNANATNDTPSKSPKERKEPNQDEGESQANSTATNLFHGPFCLECGVNSGNGSGCGHDLTNIESIEDTEILSRARMSLPSMLYMFDDHRQKGVFAGETLHANMRFGPLVGEYREEIQKKKNQRFTVSDEWKIFLTNTDYRVRDCSDENTANWMRFVRAARSTQEQNLIAFQEDEDIYFITCKEIGQHQELLYWYSRAYANVLGLSNGPDGVFICAMCKKEFHKVNNLRQHMQSCHPESLNRKFKCDTCPRAFSSASKLNTHKMSHVGIKPHSCGTCGKCFTDQSNLRNHMIIHSGERKFVCSVCERAFRQKAHLKSHMLTHTGEKRMMCRYCYKLFARRSDVRIHEMSHTREVVFKCTFPECDKLFFKKQTYNRHMLVHSGIRDFNCQCGKSFSTNYHLRRHHASCQKKPPPHQQQTNVVQDPPQTVQKS